MSSGATSAYADASSYRSVMIVNPEVLDALRYSQQPAPTRMPARDYRPIIVHVPQNGPISKQEIAEFDTYGVNIVPGNQLPKPDASAIPPKSGLKTAAPLQPKAEAAQVKIPEPAAPKKPNNVAETAPKTSTLAVPKAVEVTQQPLAELAPPPSPVALEEAPTPAPTEVASTPEPTFLVPPAYPKQRPENVPTRKPAVAPKFKPTGIVAPAITAKTDPQPTAPAKLPTTNVSEGILGTENALKSVNTGKQVASVGAAIEPIAIPTVPAVVPTATPQKQAASIPPLAQTTTPQAVKLTPAVAPVAAVSTPAQVQRAPIAPAVLAAVVAPVAATAPAAPAPAASAPATSITASAPAEGMFGDVAPDTVFSIVFSGQEKNLSDVSKGRLVQIVHAINEKHPKATLRIRAYAKPDNQDAGLARRVSLERAILVRDFIMNSGLPSDRIQVQALGLPERPSPISNRVEVVFFDTPTS
jgi:hypothetical protein